MVVSSAVSSWCLSPRAKYLVLFNICIDDLDEGLRMPSVYSKTKSGESIDLLKDKKFIEESGEIDGLRHHSEPETPA